MARQCSKEDLSIWDKFAEQLEPLRPEPSANGARSGKAFDKPKNRLGEKEREIEPVESKGANSIAKDRTLHRQMRRMDPKLRKKMIKGRIEPESFIDLSRFIHSAHRDGHRLVLVITGKGRAEIQEAGFAVQTGGGVLKKQVAQQLSSRPLSDCILDFHVAHHRHGGGGAYYVYLRRRKNF